MGAFLTDVRGFTPLIDALVAEEGLVTAAVYGVVWRYCQMADGVCTASQETIAAHLGLTRVTVNAHLRRLCEAGYLKDVTPSEAAGEPRVYADTGKMKIMGLVEARDEPRDEEGGVNFLYTPCKGNLQGGVNEIYRGCKAILHKESIKRERGERTNEDTGGADAPAQKPKSKRRIASPLDDLYRQHMGILPNRAQSEEIAATVKDVPLFATCLREWRLRGYSPTNARGVLDWYRAGGPPPSGARKAAPTAPAPSPSASEDVPAEDLGARARELQEASASAVPREFYEYLRQTLAQSTYNAFILQRIHVERVDTTLKVAGALPRLRAVIQKAAAYAKMQVQFED